MGEIAELSFDDNRCACGEILELGRCPKCNPPKRKKVTFKIPEGTRPAKCKGCGAEAFWIRTKKGKSMLVDPDGTSHFATCSKAAEFRKDRKP